MLTGVVPVIIVLIILYAIFMAVKNRNAPDTYKKHLNRKSYLAAYAYIVVIASIFMFAMGWSQLNLSLFERVYGQEFSYRPEWTSCPYKIRPTLDEPATAEPQLPELQDPNCVEGYEYDVIAAKRDLVEGITLMITALLIGLVHFMIIWSVRETDESQWVYEKFLFVGLALFGVTSLIAIPLSIYSSINFFLYGPPELGLEYIPDDEIPGPALATAIAFAPIWILYIIAFIRRMKKEK